MSLSGDRPDLLIVDQRARTVVAIVEVKYFAGDTAAARFREAADQVVRYARGYSNVASVDDLVHRSLIALSQDAPEVLDSAFPTISAIDFSAMQQGALTAWVRDRVLSPPY